MLTALGAAVDRLPGGRARRSPPRRVRRRRPAASLLLGHFDTVWAVGQLERMPLREEDGRLYGPGIFDMKAGIAIAMLAIRALRRLSAVVTRRAS